MHIYYAYNKTVSFCLTVTWLLPVFGGLQIIVVSLFQTFNMEGPYLRLSTDLFLELLFVHINLSCFFCFCLAHA